MLNGYGISHGDEESTLIGMENDELERIMSSRVK